MKTLYNTVLGSSMDLQYESILDVDAMDKAEDWAKERVEFFENWKKLVEEFDKWCYNQLTKLNRNITHGEVSKSLIYHERPMAPPDHRYCIKHKFFLDIEDHEELLMLNLGPFSRQFRDKAKQLYKKYFNGHSSADPFPGDDEYKYDVDWEVDCKRGQKTRPNIQMGSLVVKGLARFSSQNSILISLYQPVDKPDDFVNHKQLL